MANRKVLINRHSTKPQGPVASEMYLGEIAISHPTDLSATTIFTKNDDVMVPFASCAMTMQMIDNAITAANVTYNVEKGADESHIEVAKSGAGTSAVTFTLTSNDVQSQAEFETYSAATNNALTALTKAFGDLLDVTLTAGTGDSIITVTTASTDVSANTFTVTHKTATAVTGFNKLDTDTYGHVTASTAVATEDIQALGFKTSAETDEEIEELSGAVQTNETNINNLSSATLNLSAVTVTGVSLNNTPLTVANHVVSIPVADDKDDIANASATGNVADAKAVKDYVENIISSAVEYQGSTDDVPTGTPTKGDLYIASSAFTVDGKNVEVGDFIIYDGTKWDVIEKNLDGAITGNLTANTVTLGDTTNSVKSLANGSAGQVLTMGASSPEWADLPQLASAVTGTGNVVTDIAVDDHTITFAKDFTAASNADLEVVSGIVDTFSAATESKIEALSAGTIALVAASAASVFASAKTYTDEQVDEVYASATSYADGAIAEAIDDLDSETGTTDANHFITAITITNGRISGIAEAAVPAAVAITATTATPVDTASAVLTGVTASGQDNHSLTFGMSNKVFSASVADEAVSADTANSAQTSVSATVATDAVHASAATKVDNALTMTDGTNAQTYDGSQTKSLTFGTATSISGENSMSMTSDGIVDVEIIDCGTY